MISDPLSQPSPPPPGGSCTLIFRSDGHDNLPQSVIAASSRREPGAILDQDALRALDDSFFKSIEVPRHRLSSRIDQHNVSRINEKKKNR